MKSTGQVMAFRFYSDFDKPLGVSSDSLSDFTEKIKTLDLRSIEYHTRRGDFELWIHYLGHLPLYTMIRNIRVSGLSGEPLRNQLLKVLKRNSQKSCVNCTHLNASYLYCEIKGIISSPNERCKEWAFSP
jgi:hypothetical protein